MTEYSQLGTWVVVAQRAQVRAERNVRSEFVDFIGQGEKINVVEVVGRRCRIDSPMKGWLSSVIQGMQQIAPFEEHHLHNPPPIAQVF